eukprot:1119362-Pelagomonas_calceolata.AAC.1
MCASLKSWTDSLRAGMGKCRANAFLQCMLMHLTKHRRNTASPVSLNEPGPDTPARERRQRGVKPQPLL